MKGPYTRKDSIDLVENRYFGPISDKQKEQSMSYSTEAVELPVAAKPASLFPYYALVILATCLSLYLALTCQPKGDEGGLYLPAFEQAFDKWPAIDMSPYWPISSVYLWIIALLQALTGDSFGTQFIRIGRIVSLLCWMAVVVDLLRTGRYQGFIVLFNPYVLIYAIRAHPFVPSILLFYLFWNLSRRNKVAGLFFLPFAVNFQVFMAGVVGLFMPPWPLHPTPVMRAFGLGLLVIVGVGLTFLTWGGIYPINFTKHHFYNHYQKTGSPTFAYVISVLLLAGMVFWVVGERSVAQIRHHAGYSLAVVGGVLLGSLFLFFTTDIIGIAREVSVGVMGRAHPYGWVGAYGLLGLGWLRLHRDHYMVFFGLLVSALTLVSLHYFYERLSVFAFVAPCLAWCLAGVAPGRRHSWLLPLICSIFLVCSILYQRYGSL
ncbi:hypothetical protein AWR27_01335 [Spirosoma montaniterrae]|uniref:Uncharacterized protein n=2 Tax=Spirosoma montaniterrae TaxID=1178516 RepID=A0A1P9WRW0_9BACT|nr:hypothetical protein AWR27_01335 [Spirosoma montaniterrae]